MKQNKKGKTKQKNSANSNRKVNPSGNKGITMPRGNNATVSDSIGNIAGKASAYIGKWLGFGDYTINKNTIIGAGGTVPSMHSTNDGLVVRHREYIGDLFSSTTFATNTIPLNPGLIDSYPWLSKIACCFQQYKILGAVVQFIPQTSDALSTGGSLGNVTLAAQYRTDQPAYPSMTMALESEFAVSGVPSEPLVLAIECDPRLSAYNSWYVRSAPQDTNEDVKTFDFVSLNILVSSNPVALTVLGQIWISYEIELMRPTGLCDPPSFEFYVHVQPQAGVANATPIGTISSLRYAYYQNPNGTNAIGANYTSQSAQDGWSLAYSGSAIVITMPRGLTGSFEIDLTAVDATGVLNAGFSSTATFSNCTGDATTAGVFSVAYPDPGSGVIIKNCSCTAYFSITNLQASTGRAVVTLGGASTIVPNTASTLLTDLIVRQVGSNR